VMSLPEGHKSLTLCAFV